MNARGSENYLAISSKSVEIFWAEIYWGRLFFRAESSLIQSSCRSVIRVIHCVQTDPAKNVWTRAYLIPERNRTVRRQEESKNSVYLFVFCMNLGK
jgi:hypothetical protein